MRGIQKVAVVYGLFSLMTIVVFVSWSAELTTPQSVEQLAVYRCTEVEGVSVLTLEGLGKVVLIGVEAPALGAGYDKALAAVKKFCLDKSVKVEPCTVKARDEEDRVRAIVYFAENGNWYNLNTKLLRAGLANVRPELECHVDARRWASLVAEARRNGRGLWSSQVARKAKPQKAKPQKAKRQKAKPKAVPPAPPMPIIAGLPMGVGSDFALTRSAAAMANPPKARRRSRAAQRRRLYRGGEYGGQTVPTSLSLMRSYGEAILPIPPTYRDDLHLLENQIPPLLAQLASLGDVKGRTIYLERELTSRIRISRPNPQRMMEVLIREMPTSLGTVLATFPGFRVRLEQLYLHKRKELLSEIVGWFPELRDEIERRLISLGASLVDGPALGIATSAGGVGGVGGAPTGAGMPGPGGMGMGAGGVPSMAAGGAMPGMGAGGGMAGMAGGAGAGVGGAGGVAAGAAGQYYQVLGRLRAGLVEPEEAALMALAVQAYREQLNEEVQRVALQLRRVREEKDKIERLTRLEWSKVSAAYPKFRRGK